MLCQPRSIIKPRMALRYIELGSFAAMRERLYQQLPCWLAERVTKHEAAHADESPAENRFGIIVREDLGRERIVGAFVRPLLDGIPDTREKFERLLAMAEAPLRKLGDALSEADKRMARYARMMMGLFGREEEINNPVS